MYTYITMERTQIYLNETQTRELDRRARQLGTSRSHLIREAISEYLVSDWDPQAFVHALDRFAGIWADRDGLDQIYLDLKQADRDRLRRLWGDRLDEPDSETPGE